MFENLGEFYAGPFVLARTRPRSGHHRTSNYVVLGQNGKMLPPRKQKAVGEASDVVSVNYLPSIRGVFHELPFKPAVFITAGVTYRRSSLMSLS